MTNKFLGMLSNLDAFATIIITLVLYIGLCVFNFATRYMKGDTRQYLFYLQLLLIIFLVSLTVIADNIMIFFGALCLSNLLLVRLMIHKPKWKAARASGMLVLKNYLLGALCIGSALAIFYLVSGEKSIKAILNQEVQSNPILLALILMLIGAMTQSAIWPFHRWLNSSLNSPTPVSAFMHAGLVNGGGIILIRFAPLYLKYPDLLSLMFIIGITTALLGTLWKLLQSDIKKMLACSTIGQMGFMLAQCGLGLFPAALAHLVWHGMFKAYLFLGSGAAAQEKRFHNGCHPSLFTSIRALLCGLVGSIGFGFTSDKSWLANDTTLVLMVLSLLSATQFALPIISRKSIKAFLLALISTLLVGLAYGGSVRLVAWLMEPMHLMRPQPLNGFHIIGIIALTIAWLSILFRRGSDEIRDSPSWMLRYYVRALNASQPHPTTVTAYRNHYQY